MSSDAFSVGVEIGQLVVLLVLIPAIGREVNGSQRWISLHFVTVQPSEFMKLAVVLYAASYAVRKAAFLHAEQPLKQTLMRGRCAVQAFHRRGAAVRHRLGGRAAPASRTLQR